LGPVPPPGRRRGPDPPPGWRCRPDPRPHVRRGARRAALTAVVKPRRLGGSEREEGCRRGLREEGHRHGVGTRRSADVVGGRGSG